MTKPDTFDRARKMDLYSGEQHITREQAERTEGLICAHVADPDARRDLMQMLFAPMRATRTDSEGRRVYGRD